MVKEEIIEESPISMAEVKDILKKLSKKGELDIREGKTLNYLERVVKISKKQAEEKRKMLEELGLSKLKEKTIIKLIDILPKEKEELKIVLGDDAQLFKEKELNKIIEILNK